MVTGKLNKPILFIATILLIIINILFYVNSKTKFDDAMNEEGLTFFNKGRIYKISNEDAIKRINYAFRNSFDTYSLIIDPKDIKECLKHDQVLQVNYSNPKLINMTNFADIKVRILYVIIESDLFPKGSIITITDDSSIKIWAVDWRYIEEIIKKIEK